MPSKKLKVKSQKLKVKMGGFSLIELLLALSIIALVTVVAIPNLRNFNRDQEIDGAASKLVNVINNAKSSASSRIQCPNGGVSVGWNVVLNTNNYVMNCFDTANRQVFTSPYAANPTDSTTFQMVTGCSGGQTLTLYFAAQQVSYLCGSTPGSTWPITLTISNPAGSPRPIIIERGGIVR